MSADRKDSVYIIAEAGVNHNGSLKLARDLVDVAAAAGADAVKFQSFRTDDLVSQSAPRAAYQAENLGGSETQREMLRKLELSFDDQRGVAAHAAKAGIEFLSTPFDLASLDFLVRDLGLSRIKLGSGDLTNAPLLLAAARTGRDVILSSGMASLDETLTALGVLAFGYTAGPNDSPTQTAFGRAWDSERARNAVTTHASRRNANACQSSATSCARATSPYIITSPVMDTPQCALTFEVQAIRTACCWTSI